MVDGNQPDPNHVRRIGRLDQASSDRLLREIIDHRPRRRLLQVLITIKYLDQQMIGLLLILDFGLRGRSEIDGLNIVD